jgi:hypothetical protein
MAADLRPRRNRAEPGGAVARCSREFSVAESHVGGRMGWLGRQS